MPMRTPKLNALKVFDAAARHLNFRAAAAELNVTQGAVAQTVRGLEADLGVRLFRRLARGVALSDVGETYHLEIAQGLAIIDRATNVLKSGSGAVTVSVPPSFASKWLVPRLPYFFEANPGLEVRTVASESVTDFRTQDVDVAVRQGARPTGPGLFITLLAPLHLCIVCAASNARELGRDCGIEAFAGLPLIQDSHQHWDRLFNAVGIERSGHLLQFNQTALAMDASVNGQGFAVVPRLLASGDLVSGRLVEVWADIHDDQTGYWLVHPENAPSNRQARSSLVDWIIADCRNHGVSA